MPRGECGSVRSVAAGQRQKKAVISRSVAHSFITPTEQFEDQECTIEAVGHQVVCRYDAGKGYLMVAAVTATRLRRAVFRDQPEQ